MSRNALAVGFLIAGLALVFGYFGIDKLLQPLLWIGFLPLWMDGLLGFSKETWLQVFGVLELLFAAMLLFPNRRVRQAGALFIALHLIGVVMQVGWNDIGIRDIGLLFSSMALFALL